MKKITLMIVTVMMILGLAACGGNKVDDTTTANYRSIAEEVVSLLNASNYSELHTMFDKQMKEGLSVQQMEELTPLIKESGTFEKVDKFSIEEKDGHYITVLVAKYSEQKRVYTISFNAEEEIIGLFIK